MNTVEQVKDWAVLPYNTERINGHYLVSNVLGSWDLLSIDEFKSLEQFSLDENDDLFNRLYEKGVIVKEENLPKIINEYRNLQSHLFSDASLHIAVLTTRCNIACNYCQTRTEEPADMNIATAAKIIDYCFGMRNQNINLEFQGGEPLLNWDVLKFLVENIQNFNTINKNIKISLVTNGVLLNEEKVNFLVDNGVNICVSVDGPEKVHNSNRVFSDGKGTYEKVKASIAMLQEAYKKRGIPSKLALLPTLSKQSLSFAKEIIDEYVGLGISIISLRPSNKLGGAQCQWDSIGFSPEEFNHFWSDAMDYILELNKQGVNIKETMAIAMLTKILKKQNPGHVDLMSPCGAGRAVITYMPNGDLYPCDEARMVGSDMFKLGNILDSTYEKAIKNPKLFSICESSLLDLWDYNSAFLPWTGTCPVLNYMSQGNIVPKITQTPKHKVHSFQLKYLFTKIIENKKNLEIFQKWTG